MASKKYVPPNKRSKIPEIPERIDLSDKSFPVLGFVTTNSWNSHVVSTSQTIVPSTPSSNLPSLSSRIQEAMKQQEEQVESVEEDTLEGWHVLSLNSVQEVAGHFNSTGSFRGAPAYLDSSEGHQQ